MALFQKSVTNKYLKNLDTDKVNKAYESFRKFYGNAKRLANILQLKEENYQEGFLREIFVQTLGYTINPDENYNLTTEFKNQKDSRKADGAIIRNGKAIGVIELKSTKTKDLESIKEQAFGYKNNQPDCKYVITSNFQSLRLYVDNATEYEEFNLFAMASTRDCNPLFRLFYLLLSQESIFTDLPDKLKQETKFHEEKISAQLYADYKQFKNKIFNNLVKQNPQYDKLTLFKKSQKLLDRFLFVLFAEDSGLIPPNAISKIIEQWKTLKELDEYKPLYSRFQKLFTHLDKGHIYKKWGEIPAYNGGLFRNDEILDNPETIIDDAVLKKDSLKLSRYDFSTEVDVNILGHIFEHSLNEIEEITAELEGNKGLQPLAQSKRKKDGVFYTPKYITKYIVENTVGKLCDEKKAELQINNLLIDDNYFRKATTRGHVPLTKKGKQLFDTLNAYKDWLLTLKILDPACGSGAFLNATLEFLIAEHKQTDDKIAELTGESIRMFDTDKSILENNIYGVDINEESVEIAKLSLWLRTAQCGRTLSDLSGNIKCGNSLIDDPEIAGEKAFDWEKEFPQVFTEKEKTIWHITTATHNSRYSQRMFDHKVKTGEAIWLEEQDEILITETIAQIVKEDNLNVTAYNICGDHMHMILVCEEKDRDGIAGKIKAVSSRKYNIAKGITRGHVPLSDNDTDENEIDTTRGHVPLSESGNDSRNDTPDTKKEKKKYNSLWTQKYGKKRITDNEQYTNTLNYIRNNRKKHKLPESKKLQKLIDSFVCTAKHAFRTEYKGGFDVVIGNPPYVQVSEFQKFYNSNYQTANSNDLYALFIEKGTILLKNNGKFSFIIPSLFIKGIAYKSLRKFLLTNTKITEILDKGDGVFEDVKMPTAILTLSKKSDLTQKWSSFIPGGQIIEKLDSSSIELDKISNIKRGLEIGRDKVSESGQIPLLTGGNVSRYNIINHMFISEETYQEYQKENSYFTGERIIIRETGNRLTSIFLTDLMQQNRSLYSIKITDKTINPLYPLCLLNSSLIQYYYISKFAANTNVFPKIRIAQVKQVPIKSISKEAQQPFIEKADQMLSLNKALQTEKSNFLKTLQEEFGNKGLQPLVQVKITKKLDAFYEIEYDAFKKELLKQKVKISLGNKNNEWREYFNSTKQKINELQNQINQTDKEIDKMVYELYELTDEEIEIVENSVK